MNHSDRNHRILFNLRHAGLPVPGDFGADTTAVPTPGPGQFLSRTVYLALDPGYLSAFRSALASVPGLGPVPVGFAAGVPGGVMGVPLPPERPSLGDVLPGETVAQVLQSRHPDYRAGEYVVLRNGWQQFALSSGQGVRRLDPSAAPISTALGVLGLPGLTGYAGLVYLGEPRPGQTVAVSGATEPVGCTAGQTARMVGARAVGIADSEEKCDYAVRELGFAACINRRSGDLDARLKDVCPDGVDVYFDNAGGEGLPTLLRHLALHARVILCGSTAAYDGPPPAVPFLDSIVAARATVRGLVAGDLAHRLPEVLKVVGSWMRAGQFRYREDIAEGIGSAPEAFCRMVRGESFGQALVRVAPEHL